MHIVSFKIPTEISQAYQSVQIASLKLFPHTHSLVKSNTARMYRYNKSHVAEKHKISIEMPNAAAQQQCYQFKCAAIELTTMSCNLCTIYAIPLYVRIFHHANIMKIMEKM